MAASVQGEIAWHFRDLFSQLLNDFFKSAIAEWLEGGSAARLNFTQDHRDAATWKLGQDCLGFSVELRGGGIYGLLERMPDHCTGFVMQNLDRVRPFFAVVVGPP